jgi:hypothetical protein
MRVLHHLSFASFYTHAIVFSWDLHIILEIVLVKVQLCLPEYLKQLLKVDFSCGHWSGHCCCHSDLDHFLWLLGYFQKRPLLLPFISVVSIELVIISTSSLDFDQ